MGKRGMAALGGAGLFAGVTLLVFVWGSQPGGTSSGAANRGDRGVTGSAARLSDDKALALGYLLDTPAPAAAIDQGLAIAEKLRLKYGIDTGDLQADRLEASRRAKLELLDQLTFTPEQIEAAARSLGYTLDPARCASFCDNVRRLAVLELQKRALMEFAAHPRLVSSPDADKPGSSDGSLRAQP